MCGLKGARRRGGRCGWWNERARWRGGRDRNLGGGGALAGVWERATGGSRSWRVGVDRDGGGVLAGMGAGGSQVNHNHCAQPAGVLARSHVRAGTRAGSTRGWWAAGTSACAAARRGVGCTVSAVLHTDPSSPRPHAPTTCAFGRGRGRNPPPDCLRTTATRHCKAVSVDDGAA